VVRQMPHGICDYSINSRYLKPKRAAKQGPVANSQEAIPLVGQGAYDAYKDKARDVAALFTEATGIPVRKPSLDQGIWPGNSIGITCSR
jgi:hypothetical protein